MEKIYIGRFALGRELGRGSFGKVFEAVDLFDGSRVAVKISDIKGNDYLKYRNTKEALILNALKDIESPYRRLVVDLRMSIVLEDSVVLALELLSCNLTKSIRTGALSDLSRLSVLAKQMVEFLCFMSQADAIHGDIKPENILHELEGDGIKFVDFGLSHCSLFKEKVKGIQTLGYMAPEVILGLDYDSSVDIWSVGCVLFECLTKERLFPVGSKLDMLQDISLIIGTPDQKTIELAPSRDEFFTYDVKSDMWIVKGLHGPKSPMGMTAYLRLYHDINATEEARFESFVDLVEGMLRLNPRDRYTPRMCLEHSFFANFDVETASYEFTELVDEKEDLCQQIGPLKDQCLVKNDVPADQRIDLSVAGFLKVFKKLFVRFFSSTSRKY